MKKTHLQTVALPMLGFTALFVVASVAPASAGPNQTVVLQATGNGTALTIDIYDPNAEPRMYNVALPFNHSVSRTVNSGDLYQIVAVPKGTTQPGCRITVDGRVVAEQPVGGSGQCVFTAS
jgi:Mycobacterium membrane protein